MEIGETFGDPWFATDDEEKNYFEVIPFLPLRQGRAISVITGG